MIDKPSLRLQEVKEELLQLQDEYEALLEKQAQHGAADFIDRFQRSLCWQRQSNAAMPSSD
jgi:hypothetical protein